MNRFDIVLVGAMACEVSDNNLSLRNPPRARKLFVSLLMTFC